ncbi:hypothetical protein SAMN05428952_10926 [Nitrosomonas sp. Nm132]|nr:hypothetical protein SAMN05428952_10926 [Nitrosomonas sp. Nm132]
MSIIDLLHNLLKEKVPGIHATRLQALMAAVQAGLKGAPVSITQLGRSLVRTCLYQTQNQAYGSLSRQLPSQQRTHGDIRHYDPMAIAIPAHALDPYRLVAPDNRSASATLTSGFAHGRAFRYLARRNSSR